MAGAELFPSTVRLRRYVAPLYITLALASHGPNKGPSLAFFRALRAYSQPELCLTKQVEQHLSRAPYVMLA